MLIEIKDLPKDRNIKRVSFDIEFEDGEIKTVIPMQPKFVEKPVCDEPYVYKTDNVLSFGEQGPTKTFNNNEKLEPIITPPNTNIEREKKEVPSEMLDMEF